MGSFKKVQETNVGQGNANFYVAIQVPLLWPHLKSLLLILLSFLRQTAKPRYIENSSDAENRHETYQISSPSKEFLK